ncbi:hypothetical protein H310_01801 [Aphanomyces invadans]|uniref:WRKY transcription factor 19 n=1 Tax=Aphanomyces invadans TaxID=157072 RepID=A0A024UM19_9STRA|nr:hypothetical protein H310_01801 [Aphanomyces invadans]ETW07235.1 hypothetical protein H310_01801 [Aphanomyces invadans]|eukprot:XP_008863328.1 hypothetical protein H310_01801 [Aphanomyces invadans]
MSTTTLASCIFNGCTRPASLSLDATYKCAFHWHRARCLASPTCFNQVFARHRCVRHGGRKQCQVDGCYLNARLGSVCSKHGASAAMRVCTHPGCTTRASARKKCIKHGGGRPCQAFGCTAHARTRGYCRKHTTTMTKTSVERHAGCFPNHGIPRRESIKRPTSSIAFDIADMNDMLQMIKDEVVDCEEPIEFIHPLDKSTVDGSWWIDPDVATELLELLTVQGVAC